MKIKPPSRKHKIKALLKQLYIHWWLAPEKPKKAGRLSQLNKSIHRQKRPSEFILMAIKLENEIKPVVSRR